MDPASFFSSVCGPECQYALDLGLRLLGLALLGNIGAFLVSHFWVTLRGSQNLKKKYNADWAVVTGGSSGIGYALVEKLAQQGLNVVIAAFPDKFMEDATETLTKKYPDVKFKFVPVNLAEISTCVKIIAEACANLEPQVVFLNAGYILTGEVAVLAPERQVANMNVNSVSQVLLGQYFLQRMRDSGKKGCIVFTCSGAAYLSSPFQSIYSATKAFIAAFVASVAVEAQLYNVDVHAVFPSPVLTNFTANMDSRLEGLRVVWTLFGSKPDGLPDQIFSCIGRIAVFHDMGAVSVGLRILLKFLDQNGLAYFFKVFGRMTPEYRQFQASQSAPPPKPVPQKPRAASRSPRRRTKQ